MSQRNTLYHQIAMNSIPFPVISKPNRALAVVRLKNYFLALNIYPSYRYIFDALNAIKPDLR